MTIEDFQSERSCGYLRAEVLPGIRRNCRLGGGNKSWNMVGRGEMLEEAEMDDPTSRKGYRSMVIDGLWRTAFDIAVFSAEEPAMWGNSRGALNGYPRFLESR